MNRILFLAATLLFAACTSDTNKHGNESTAVISLNNGEKWEVNEEMKPHIVQGMDILNDYVDSEGTDYSALANSLKEQNSNLINSCTMDGKGHDELHNWLLPHMDLIKELGKAESSAEANGIVTKLKSSFQDYNKYFK